MITEGRMKEALKEFFTRKGFTHLQEKLDYAPENAEVFTKERDSVAVYTVPESMILSRGVILKTVMDASVNLKRCNQTYIALPKILASMIDAAVIEPYGIGILVLDKEGVTEVLPPRYFDNTPTTADLADSRVGDELRELRSQVDSLKRMLKMLSTELEDLRAKKEVDAFETISVVEPSAIFERAQKSENIPEFIKDNPWITVLSRRGRE